MVVVVLESSQSVDGCHVTIKKKKKSVVAQKVKFYYDLLFLPVELKILFLYLVPQRLVHTY